MLSLSKLSKVVEGSVGWRSGQWSFGKVRHLSASTSGAPIHRPFCKPWTCGTLSLFCLFHIEARERPQARHFASFCWGEACCESHEERHRQKGWQRFYRRPSDPFLTESSGKSHQTLNLSILSHIHNTVQDVQVSSRRNRARAIWYDRSSEACQCSNVSIEEQPLRIHYDDL